MDKALKNRLKSLLWRAGGMAVVAMSAYLFQVGDIFSLEAKTLVNIGVLTFMGLVVNEITKILNTK